MARCCWVRQQTRIWVGCAISQIEVLKVKSQTFHINHVPSIKFNDIHLGTMLHS